MRLRYPFGALFTIAVVGSAVAQGDPLADGAEARVVFERALTADSRAEWEVLVGLGIEAGGYDGTDARAIGQMLLVRWLTERWIAQVGAPDRQMVVDAIAEGNRRYLYRYDAQRQRYQRDAAGDLAIKGIAGHSGPGGERAAWLGEVGEAKEAALSAWRGKTKATYLELVASEGLDAHGAVARALAASIGQYEDAARRDLTALIVRHELQFSHLRLQDTLSARRAGEGGSARAITDRLVGAAERELGAAREALEAAIPGEHTAAAVRVSADAWRESFREQFAAGLESWGEAEDRFVAQRLKWERDAGAAYRAAEAEWDQAFRTFGEAREAWLAKMHTLLIGAEARWRQTLERFGQDVRSELTDLAGAHAKEQAARRDEARTYLAAFQQAAGVLAMAQKNITYLTERRDALQASIVDMRGQIEVLRQPEYDAQRAIEKWEAKLVQFTKSKVVFINGYVLLGAGSTFIRGKIADARERKAEAIADAKAAIDALHRRLSAPQSDLETIKTELAYWQGRDENGGLRQQFRKIRDQARDRIGAFAARIGGGVADTSSIDQERGRLEALIAMLHDERSIARAVVGYAEDTSSDRATRAQTAARLVTAREAMRRAESAYRAAIAELQRRSSEEVAAKEGDLEREQRALTERHRALADTKQHLQNAMDAYRLEDPGVFDRLLGAIDASNRTFLTQDSRTLVSAYAEGAWQAMVAEQIATSDTVAAHLASGASDGAFISTRELTEYRAKLGKIELTGTGSAAEFTTHLLTTVGLAPDDPNVQRLADAYRAVLGGEDARAQAVARLELQALYDQLVAAADYRILVRRRELALVRGHYAQDGTRRSATTASVPVILQPERAVQLEAQLALRAAQAELAYRTHLLSVQVGVNTALGKAAEAAATWRAGPRAVTMADALEQALDVDDPVESLAFTLFLNGKVALADTALAAVSAARDHLAAADTRTVAAISAALADRTVAAAGAHAAQFTGGGANLLDRLVRTERRAHDAAAAELAALNSSGRAGHAWLEVRLGDQVRKLTRSVETLTRAVDTAVAANRAIDPEHVVTAYRALVKAEAPDALVDTVGLYARALAAEGRLTALGRSAIDAIDVADPTTRPERTRADRARAHRRLATVLQPPGAGVTLAHLAGRGLPAGVAQPDALTAGRYRSMLDTALAALGLHAEFRTNGDLAAYTRAAGTMPATGQTLQRLRTAFVDAEARYRDHLAQRVAVGTQRQTFVSQQASYYATTIVGLQHQVDTRKREAEAQEARVRTALAAFTTAAARYQAQGRAVAAAERGYQSARLALRTAEAIDAYARSGSVEAGPNPQAALAAADRKLGAARTALAAVTQLIARREAVPQRDARYQTLLEAERNHLQAAQEFALTADHLASAVGTLDAQIRTAGNAIIELIRTRGQYGETDDWIPSDLDVGAIRADRLHGRTEEFGNPAAYFSGDAAAVARTYATDLGSWIFGIQEQGGSEFLRKMSVALMYELGTAQRDTGPFRDENGAIKPHLTPHVFGTTQARRLIALSKSKTWIFFDSNGHSKSAAIAKLHSRTAGTYHAVKATPEYAFFRLMMASGKHGTLLKQIVNDDIQQRAVQSLIQDGHAYRGSLSWFWHRRERRDISRAIGAMPHITGAPERDRFLAKGRLTGELAAWRAATAKRTAMRGTTPTLAAVQAQIGRAGGTANPAVTAAIRYVLTGGSAADRKGIVSVVTAAAQRITHVLATTNRGLVARARELAAVAQPLQHTYLATLGRFLDGRAQRSELTRALAARYRHPAYDTADALAARIANVQQVTPHTTAGELTQLRMLIDHTLAAGVQQDADLRLRLLHRYTIDQEQLERGIDRTKAATLELITRAHTEWDRSFTRLEGRRKRWRRDTAERYHKRAELWNRRHAALAAGRDRWLEAATRTGIVAGSRELAVQWDLEANALIADAERVVIPSFAGHTPDLSALVHAATGGSVLADLIEQAEYLQSRAQDTNVVVAASLPQITTGAAEAQVAHSLTQTIFDQVTERAAVLSAIRARELFATQREAIDSGIESANQDLHDKLTNRMEAAGYRRDGALWRRQSIIGSTVLGGTEWETHQVAVYRDFIAPGFSGRTDLSTPALTGLSGTAIATLVDQATEEMARYQVLIFGRSEQQKKATTKDGKRNERYVTPVGAAEFRDTLAQVLREAEAAWKRGANSERTGDTEGLFNYHVGYDPVMEGESIKQAGYGQLGVIMGAFFTNEARLHRGHTALMTPIHRKPLWDDDADNDGKSDSLFGAPTVATVVDVGVAVALTAAGAGPLAVAALSLVDDVLFTTADVATGYQDTAAAFGQLGIRAATSVAGAATGGLINGVGGQHASGFLVQGLSGTIGSGVTNTVGAAAIDAGFAMATSGINTVMAAGITTAFTGGEWDDFTGGLDSWEHWRGTTIAGVRGAAGSLTRNFFTQDGTGETIVAGTSIDTKALAGAASLSTTAITAGAEYAITDRTTVNLAALNFKYQADGRESTSSTGLLELRLGGAGTSLHLGTGGYRADLGTIAKTIGGRSDVLGVTRAKLAGEGSHALGVLNTANYLAIGGMRQLSQEIWGRKVAVAFEDLGEDYGYYHHSEDPNRIVINRRSNTNDREDVAVLAAGAAHEGQHRYDRTFHGRTSEYSAHRSGAAVYLNLMHGLGLKGNDRLMQSIAAGLMSEQSKQTNTGPVDHWRLTADGGLEFDGSGYLRNEDGDYINEDGSITPYEDGPIKGLTIGAAGIETGLLRILTGENTKSYRQFGDEQKSVAQQMMRNAGLSSYLDGEDPITDRYWDRNIPTRNQVIRVGAIAEAGFGTSYSGILWNTMDEYRAYDILSLLGLSGDRVDMRGSTTDIQRWKTALSIRDRAYQNTLSDDVQPGYPSDPGLESGLAAQPGAQDGTTWCNRCFYRNVDQEVAFADDLLSESGIGYTNANQMVDAMRGAYPQVDGATAQLLANLGFLVGVGYRNPADDLPGHVALVVADDGLYDPSQGPTVAQAGTLMGIMSAADGFGGAFGQATYSVLLPDALLEAASNIPSAQLPDWLEDLYPNGLNAGEYPVPHGVMP